MRFEVSVEQPDGALLRLAYVLTGNAHRAEDLSQNALTPAFRKWRHVSAAVNPDAYVRSFW